MARFVLQNDLVVSDTATGLEWTKDAALSEFPLTWQEALDFVRDLNRSAYGGCADWKLPNRRELFSLVSHETINPSLPAGHPFENVFHGYYWTATTCHRLPDQAWYVHLGGARVFKGMKHGSYMVWPVRLPPETPGRVIATGQRHCYDSAGQVINCAGSGQDGASGSGVSASPRFIDQGDVFYDTLTRLTWLKPALCPPEMMDWPATAERVARMNQDLAFDRSDWRVPHVVELESLADMGRHLPAVAIDFQRQAVRPFYWSATTSAYNPDYTWVLYTSDGPVGVGFKPLAEFFLWPVADGHGPAVAPGIRSPGPDAH